MSATQKQTYNIFAISSNNFQSSQEYAPGSGLLHQLHHESYNTRDDVKMFSMFPSCLQKVPECDFPERVRIFELPHAIPVCESCSPNSKNRWHSFSEKEFAAYRERLTNEIESYINEIEEKENKEMDLFIAHHCFINVLVMAEINRRRVANKEKKKSRVATAAFCHGTAILMFKHELDEHPEFPRRYLDMMRREGVFDKNNEQDAVDAVFVISNDQIAKFQQIFGETFPKERIVLAPNGFNSKVFRPIANLTKTEVFKSFKPIYSPNVKLDEKMKSLDAVPADKFDKFVVFVGKMADWKRLDVFLKSAKIVRDKLLQAEEKEKQNMKIGFVCCGSGPEEDVLTYHQLAFEELGLADCCFFLGSQQQPELAKIHTVSDLFVLPSRNEPHGLVWVEAMSCRCPVLAAASGGPLTYINDKNGGLIEESSNHDELAQRFADKIIEAVDWKKEKGDFCLEFANKEFSTAKQCTLMLESVKKILSEKNNNNNKKGKEEKSASATASSL